MAVVKERFDLQINQPDHDCFIYFLISEDEVVYVGQTKNGLSRPCSHKDKVYDRIGIMYCYEEFLDKVESDFILKYKPKYNVSLSSCSLPCCKKEIRKHEKYKSFTLNDLRKRLKVIGVEIVSYNGRGYLRMDDLKRLHESLGIE